MKTLLHEILQATGATVAIVENAPRPRLMKPLVDWRKMLFSPAPPPRWLRLREARADRALARRVERWNRWAKAHPTLAATCSPPSSPVAERRQERRRRDAEQWRRLRAPGIMFSSMPCGFSSVLGRRPPELAMIQGLPATLRFPGIDEPLSTVVGARLRTLPGEHDFEPGLGLSLPRLIGGVDDPSATMTRLRELLCRLVDGGAPLEVARVDIGTMMANEGPLQVELEPIASSDTEAEPDAGDDESTPPRSES